MATREVSNHNGKHEQPGAKDARGHDPSMTDALKMPLQASEVELLGEVVTALRSMKYGSVVLTVHEGHLVEIETSVRIRKSRTAR